MIIRFNVQRVTPTKTYLGGREYDLPEPEARQWIANGVADAVEAVEAVEAKAMDEPPSDKSVKAPRRKKSA